jgi:hypothetical protein
MHIIYWYDSVVAEDWLNVFQLLLSGLNIFIFNLASDSEYDKVFYFFKSWFDIYNIAKSQYSLWFRENDNVIIITCTVTISI